MLGRNPSRYYELGVANPLQASEFEEI